MSEINTTAMNYNYKEPMDKNRVREKDINVCVFSYNSINIKALKAK